ncbi:MAG: hypothetical protein EAX89_08990 [Candidatus Lokiarchaeota archaeon]|nr:hypothetical protein [Candidatus Lokiarchaeota archaeon]
MIVSIYKIKNWLIRFIYVLITLLSTINLIFRDLFYSEIQAELLMSNEAFMIFEIFSSVFGTTIFGLIFVSVIFFYKFRFRLASIFGFFSCYLMIIDLNNILRTYGLIPTIFIAYYYFIMGAIIAISIYLMYLVYIPNKKASSLIKKLLLNFGTKFARLEVRDISEKSAINRRKVEHIIFQMVANKEIYAEYSKKKKFVEFNKEANIEQIDRLMEKYRIWEENIYKKKEI